MTTRKKPKANRPRRKAPAVGRTRHYQHLQKSRQALLAHQKELVWKARIDTIGHVVAAFRHETRNLLGALGTCVQILRRNPQISADDAELLDIIQSGSRRLNEMVSEFAAFRPHRPPQLQEVNLHEFIEETLILLKRDDRCRASAIIIHRNFDPSVRTIKADRDQLGQLLWSLFLNAAQAMGVEGQLRVETKRAGKTIKVLVHDTGPGISPTDLPKIFDPFYTTKSGAMGLGLAGARYIIERHGGQITVKSDPGKGTCVTVVLPIEPEDEPHQSGVGLNSKPETVNPSV